MGKPTIREILTDFDITDPKHELLAERVEAVLTVHHLTTDERWPKVCADCFKPWPCPTIRALNGEQP